MRLLELMQEGGMPALPSKHKQRLANMTDKELADRHGDTDETKLRFDGMETWLWQNEFILC